MTNLLARLALLGFVLVAGCGEATPPSVSSAEAHSVITAHVRAFNARDIPAMTALQHPEIEWYGVADGEVTLEIDGRDALAEMMEGYAEANPTARGALSGWSVNGDWIAVTETATWTTDDGETGSQSALAVYQMEDGLIRRVWYYPPVRE